MRSKGKRLLYSPRGHHERLKSIPVRELILISVDREDYTHLNDSKINQIIRNFSEFCTLTYKNKDPDTFDFYKIQRVGKRLGLKLNLKQMQEEGFKNKEFANPIKEKLLYKIWEIINSENGFDKAAIK